MPVGIQRLNSRHQVPNEFIIFIKPLDGPSSSLAENFLSRVAAISHPIMKAHRLSVMSLEEYEPNPEFIGRNFNAGEVIQLVLKSKSGAWMSFESVVLVMMHELAHCKQMNHSKEFWNVNNGFKREMKELWAKGYTGEGIWGRGRQLVSGEFENQAVGLQDMPASICGGMYRKARGRKRGRLAGDAPRLSYAERQQRRIAKKFGTNGVTLGDNEDTRVKLEDGKKQKGKPRVAHSARGRELRAAAALARFGQAKEEDAAAKKEDDEYGSDSEQEGDYEDVNLETKPAIDLDGSELLDTRGYALVKVCEGDNSDDVYVKEEMQELQDLNQIPKSATHPERSSKNKRDNASSQAKGSTQAKLSIATPSSATPGSSGKEAKGWINPHELGNVETSCAVCSMANPADALLCAVCSHVLNPERSAGSWKCPSEACKDSTYVNSVDYGVCRVCGRRKTIG